MQDTRIQTLFFSIAIATLCGFQALVVWGWFPDLAWFVASGCLAFDVLLTISYCHATRRRRKSIQKHLDQVQDVLLKILTLAHGQQTQWKTLVDSLAGHEYEDAVAIESIRSLVDTMAKIDEIPTSLSRKQWSIEPIIDAIQTVILLSHSLMGDLDRLLTFFGETYTKLQDVKLENKMVQFRLRESVQFLSAMSQATNRYSDQLFHQILQTFEDIITDSRTINADVKTSVSLMMDPKNPESLESINRETRAINVSLDEFFVELEKTIAYSGQYLSENAQQMERIRAMSEAIAEFAENIRMISLNVNIEAARTTFGSIVQNGNASSGKGFQVLAVKLSEYASKAQELAHQQQEVIGSATNVMHDSGAQLKSLLDTLVSHIPSIQSKLHPFEHIVATSFARFEAVVSEMDGLSESIDSKLKSVLGKLQFQDLVRQEQEHLLSMFTLVRDLAEMASASKKELDERQRSEAINVLLRFYESIASTENELNVIRDYRVSHPFLSTKERSDELTAGTVKLF